MQRPATVLRSQSGAAMIVALCLGAVLMALSAALLYAASQLGASAARLLPQEQAYQLARTFSDRLDADLCAAEPTSVQTFLSESFLQDQYADGLDYAFTAADTAPQDDYGQLRVTLRRQLIAAENERSWYPEEGYTAETLTNQMDTFQHPASDFADYRIDVTVTAVTGDAEFSYTQRYERQAGFRVIYTLGGQDYYRQAETLQFYPLTDPELAGPAALTLEEDDLPGLGRITARYDLEHPVGESRYRNLIERGN